MWANRGQLASSSCKRVWKWCPSALVCCAEKLFCDDKCWNGCYFGPDQQQKSRCFLCTAGGFNRWGLNPGFTLNHQISSPAGIKLFVSKNYVSLKKFTPYDKKERKEKTRTHVQDLEAFSFLLSLCKKQDLFVGVNKSRRWKWSVCFVIHFMTITPSLSLSLCAVKWELFNHFIASPFPR